MMMMIDDDDDDDDGDDGDDGNDDDDDDDDDDGDYFWMVGVLTSYVHTTYHQPSSDQHQPVLGPTLKPLLPGPPPLS